MSINRRAIFEQLRKKYAGISKGSVRLAESSLFFTKDIDSTKSVYNFDILENQTGVNDDEIRLNQNDEFICTDLGVYLYGEWRNANNESGASAPQLLTYAPMEIAGTAVASKGLYAGKLSFSVNNINYMEKWRLRKHEVIPITQFASQPVAAAGPPVITNAFPATLPSLNYNRDGMVPLASVLTFSGAKKNLVSIALPEAIAASIANYVDKLGTTNYINITKIAVVMDGFNAQNAASFQGVVRDKQ